MSRTSVPTLAELLSGNADHSSSARDGVRQPRYAAAGGLMGFGAHGSDARAMAPFGDWWDNLSRRREFSNPAQPESLWMPAQPEYNHPDDLGGNRLNPDDKRYYQSVDDFPWYKPPAQMWDSGQDPQRQPWINGLVAREHAPPSHVPPASTPAPQMTEDEARHILNRYFGSR